MILSFAVLVQYRRVTDRRTDTMTAYTVLAYRRAVKINGGAYGVPRAYRCLN